MVKLREKKVSGNRVSFYLDIYNEATKTRRYHFLKLHAPSKRADKELYTLARRDAERIRTQFEADAALDRYGVANGRKLTMNAVDYFAECIKDKRNQNYSSALRAFKEFCKGEATFESITPERCEQYQRFLLQRQKSTGGAIVYYTHFVSMLNKAVKDGIIQVAPHKRAALLIKNRPPMLPYLTFSEVQALERTPCQDDELKRAFLFMVFTGIRVSDARSLKWTDIGGDVLTIRIQKTQQPHTVPLIPAALHLLDAQRLTSGQYEQVFRIPNDGVNMLNRWATSAGISKRIGFHTARRTFASLAAQRGVDVGTIKELLGHSTLQMSLRYAQVNLESKRNALMVLEAAHQ